MSPKGQMFFLSLGLMSTLQLSDGVGATHCWNLYCRQKINQRRSSCTTFRGTCASEHSQCQTGRSSAALCRHHLKKMKPKGDLFRKIIQQTLLGPLVELRERAFTSLANSDAARAPRSSTYRHSSADHLQQQMALPGTAQQRHIQLYQ